MLSLLYWCLIVFALIGLAVFIAPFFLKVVNAGNLVGIALFGMLLSAVIFYQPCFRLTEHLWSTVGGKILLILLAVCLVMGMVLAGYFTLRMLIAQNRKPPENTPVVPVVLGCKVRGTKPSLMLQRRLDTAFHYLTTHPAAICIVSGGQGADEIMTEAEAMQRYLIQKGIASERILMENQSENTAQNLRYSAALLKKLGLPNTVLIITDGFHQYRASLLAKRAGLEAFSKSCHTRTILIPTYWVRELMALFKRFL